MSNYLSPITKVYKGFQINFFKVLLTRSADKKTGYDTTFSHNRVFDAGVYKYFQLQHAVESKRPKL